MSPGCQGTGQDQTSVRKYSQNKIRSSGMLQEEHL